MVPDRKVVGDDDRGSAVGGDKDPVGQTDPGRAMLGSASPLEVQLRVHVLGVSQRAAVRFGPQRSVRDVGAVSTFRARTVSGGQGDGLVEEEQRRVAVGLPLRHSAAPKRQHTGDPRLVLMTAHDVAGAASVPDLVQTTAIAHPGAAA